MAGPELCLISTPWLPPTQPCLPLAVLKSYIQHHHVSVQSIHSHVVYADAIGMDIHRALMNPNQEPAELLFGALMNRSRKTTILLTKLLRQQSEIHGVKMPPAAILFTRVARATSDIVRAIAPTARIVGISVGPAGLPAALWIAEQIKKINPCIITVIGGSALDTAVGKAVVDHMRQVDCYIAGEGEIPLLKLVQSAQKFSKCRDSIPSLYARGRTKPLNYAQISDINTLPTPDFDDYMQVIDRLMPQVRASVTLPLEGSRGCWWGCSQKMRGACSFCSAYQMWKGYRAKNGGAIARDIERLANRHRILDFQLVDNTLPASAGARSAMFEAIAKIKKDLLLVVSTRATLQQKDIDVMYRAGVRCVYVGIEAIDDHILEIMKKGTTLYHNLKTVKLLRESRIYVASNVIFSHPGCKKEDVNRSAAIIDDICHLQPPSYSHFQLLRRSDVYAHPSKYGVVKVVPAKAARAIYGQKMAGLLADNFEWKTSRGASNKTWAGFEKKWARWWRDYYESDSMCVSKGLTWRQNGDCIHVVDLRRPQAKSVYVLSRRQSAVFAAFEGGAPINEVRNRLKLSSYEMRRIINTLQHLKILYADGVNALSLPLRWVRC